MEKAIYYEDYELGSVRETMGRTITETDIVIHAGQVGDFFHIIWMQNGVKLLRLVRESHMEHLRSVSQ